MNRGLLIGLIVLTVTAVLSVLFFPSHDLEPLNTNDSGFQLQQNENPDLSAANLDANATRKASQTNSGSSTQAGSDSQTITGQVRRSQDGRPLPYAKLVYAHRQFGGTDIGWSSDAIKALGVDCEADGRFTMPADRRQSDLQVVAWAPGYSVVRIGELSVGDSVNFVLEPLVVVSGIVFDPEGQPAAGISVELFDPSNHLDGFPCKGVTDVKGEFAIKANLAKDAAIRVQSGAGAAFERTGIDIRPGMAAIRIDLSGEVSLVATITDEVGQPVPGAILSLSQGKTRNPLEAKANTDGVARFFGLGAGAWDVEIQAEGFATQNEKFDLSTNGNAEFTWLLRRFSSLRVFVMDGKNRPLEGAVIQLLPNPNGLDSHLRFPPTATNFEGITLFPEVPPGQFVVAPEFTPGISPTSLFEEEGQVGGKSAAHFSQLIEVTAGMETEVNLILKRHGKLTVQVLRNGQPVSGARGVLWKSGTMPHKSRDAYDLSDLQGMLEFPAVWMGEYELEIQGSPNEISSRIPLDCGRGVNSFTVDLPTGTLSGTVKDQVGPVLRAAIWGGYVGSKSMKMGETDSAGFFQLSGFEAGEYQIRIEAEEHLTWNSEALHHDGSQVQLGTIELVAAYSISGKVSGLKVQKTDFFGPMISASDPSGKLLRTLPLNSDGSFLMEGIPAGTVIFQVHQGGNIVHTRNEQVPFEGGTLQIEL